MVEGEDMEEREGVSDSKGETDRRRKKDNFYIELYYYTIGLELMLHRPCLF